MQYETTIELPENIKAFFDALTGQARIDQIRPGKVTVVIEGEDLWDVAGRVQEMRGDVESVDPSFAITVPKPIMLANR